MRHVPKQVDDAFYAGQRSIDVPFVINDAVAIVAGEYRGITGAAISIESFRPKVQLRIECGKTGADVIVPIDAVRLLQDGDGVGSR